MQSNLEGHNSPTFPAICLYTILEIRGGNEVRDYPPRDSWQLLCKSRGDETAALLFYNVVIL